MFMRLSICRAVATVARGGCGCPFTKSHEVTGIQRNREMRNREMKTKPFNLEEVQAGAIFSLYGKPARYIGLSRNRCFPIVVEYGDRVTSETGNAEICLLNAEGETPSAYTAVMIVPEPIYPDWIIQAAKHNQMPWIAQDENLGVWIYRTEPRIWGPGFGNGGRGCFLLTDSASIGCDWKDSLYEVPQ